MKRLRSGSNFYSETQTHNFCDQKCLKNPHWARRGKCDDCNGWHYRIYLCLKWLRRWACCNRGIFLFKIWLISIHGFLVVAIVFVYSWPQDKNMRPKLWLPTTRILPLKIKTSLCYKRKYRENLYKSGVKVGSHLFSVNKKYEND